MKINVLIGVSLVLVPMGNAAASTLTVISDHAFIDNRPSNDPLLTGLNLNLDVRATDSVGGTAALLLGTATFVSSNPSYNLPATPMSLITSFPGGADWGATPPGVTVAEFPNIQGTFTFTVTDANGTVMDTSHPLDFLEVLGFATNLTFSNNSTTPTFSFTDPNAAPAAGLTRFYEMRIYDASLNQVFSSPVSTTPSFPVPPGILVAGHQYDFRANIGDADTAEIAAFLAGGIHDPTEDRSVAWALHFTPSASSVPEPASYLLIGAGLLGIGFAAKRSSQKH